MNDTYEMILMLFGMIFILFFMEFLEYEHKEKYKDYYYIKEYDTPERPVRTIYHGYGTRKIEQPPFPTKKDKT